MKTAALLNIACTAGLVSGSCTRMGYVHLGFYGYPDNSPPSGDTAYNCGGRNYTAGGTGTYSDPVTLASAEGEFNECEVVYIPYIEKYARYEDYCAQCTVDFSSNIRHLSIWSGSSDSSLNGGADQQACEATLTPNHNITIVRKPDSTYPVDITPFYKKGTVAEPASHTGAASQTGVAPHSASESSNVGGGGEDGNGGGRGGVGNTTTFIINVMVKVSVNMGGQRKRKRGVRGREGYLDERGQGSCSGNLYPDNEATKVCTT